MILDVYNKFLHDPSYHKLMGSDYMIMEYKCPIETDLFQVFTEMHIITYVISGRKDWITGDQVCSISEGDALFIRKGVYTIRQHFDVDHCILTFFFNDDFIRRFVRDHQSGGVLNSSEIARQQLFKLDVTDALRTLFISVYNYMKLGADIPRGLVEIKFSELLYNIVLNPRHRDLAGFFASLNQTRRANLEHVMLKHFQHDLSMEDFARLCGRSLSAFKRDFSQHYGETPAKWLKDKRLDYACTLLRTSDRTVNEICFDSGFNNASHFIRAFREKFGVSPNQFRDGSLRAIAPA